MPASAYGLLHDGLYCARIASLVSERAGSGSTVWFQIAGRCIVVDIRHESLRSALDAVPLPLHEAGAPVHASAALRLTLTSSEDLPGHVADARLADGTALTIPASPEIGTPVELLVCSDGATFICDGHGVATVSADGTEAEVIVAEPTSLAAGALVASVVLATAAEFGFSPVHASLADRDERAVMFCGERSMGKSSSCMALARAGWTVRADDRCYVHTCDGDTMVWGAGGSISLRPGAANLWPDLQQAMQQKPPETVKHVVKADEVGGRAEAGSVRCDALLFPTVIGEGPHRIEPIPRADALPDLLFTTGLAAIPAHAALHFRHLTALVEQTPCYRMELGRDMDALPAAIGEALE